KKAIKKAAQTIQCAANKQLSLPIQQPNTDSDKRPQPLTSSSVRKNQQTSNKNHQKGNKQAIKKPLAGLFCFARSKSGISVSQPLQLLHGGF
ncbi:MAG: hypothetical protein KA455_07340, partial [Brachymonas sp.]|nr:hypothetical protein [Brachymonas sp.]